MQVRELLNEFVGRGLIQAHVAERVLRDAELSGNLPEDLLYEEHLIDEVEAAKVKSELLKVPYKKIDTVSIEKEVLKFIPFETARTYRVVPLEKRDNLLIVGMLHPDDEKAQEALRFVAKREHVSLGIYLIVPSDLPRIFRLYGSYQSEIESAVKELHGGEDEERIISLEEGGRSEDAPIIKIVASTLRQAVEAGVSDIHIEPQRSRLRIRFRIDGNLEEAVSLPLTLSRPVVSRVKVLAKLKLDETRIPQDGRFRTVVFGKDIDYRVSTFPTPSGEKAAIRVLDPTTGLKNFEDIGLNEYNLKILQEGIQRPYGMFLITGPTGSGKTTTLYAVLQKMNSDSVNIITLEDPVEYFMEGINQSQIKPEIGYTFASGLRQILRQDPDVIMVGEVRDGETASLAVNAALTGHVMLSTLHTNNALGVIPRLIDLGVPAFLLPSALNYMLAQRLVGRLCPDCKKSRKPPEAVLKIIRKEIETMPPEVARNLKISTTDITTYAAELKSSCKVCKGKGKVGRIALVEIFQMTRELSDTITSGFTETKLWAEAKRQGMITLRQDGIIKALEGKVAIEDVLKETEDSYGAS